MAVCCFCCRFFWEGLGLQAEGVWPVALLEIVEANATNSVPVTVKGCILIVGNTYSGAAQLNEFSFLHPSPR